MSTYPATEAEAEAETVVTMTHFYCQSIHSTRLQVLSHSPSLCVSFFTFQLFGRDLRATRAEEKRESYLISQAESSKSKEAKGDAFLLQFHPSTSELIFSVHTKVNGRAAMSRILKFEKKLGAFF